MMGYNFPFLHFLGKLTFHLFQCNKNKKQTNEKNKQRKKTLVCRSPYPYDVLMNLIMENIASKHIIFKNQEKKEIVKAK